MLRQARLDDRLGGLVDVVRDPVEAAVHSLGVELQPGGARIAVARLADAAGVDQPGAARPGRAARRRPPGRRAPPPLPRSPSGRTKKSATCEWPIRPIALGLQRPCSRLGLLDREHVLPDRVARGGVEEADAAPAAGGLERPQELDVSAAPRSRASRRPRPRRPTEKEEMSSSPSTARSWLPTRQIVAALADQLGAAVGLGAVADDVAEAPDLLDASRRRSPRAPPRGPGRLEWMSLITAARMALRPAGRWSPGPGPPRRPGQGGVYRRDEWPRVPTRPPAGSSWWPRRRWPPSRCAEIAAWLLGPARGRDRPGSRTGRRPTSAPRSSTARPTSAARSA